MRTLQERETIISYNQAESEGNVYTFDPKVIRRLKKASEEQPEEVKVVKEMPTDGGMEFSVPKKWISVRPPRKNNLTDEQRAKVGERLAAARAAREGEETDE